MVLPRLTPAKEDAAGSSESLGIEQARPPARSFSQSINRAVHRKNPVRPRRETQPSLPEVSAAWTPSLSTFHTRKLLTEFEVEEVLRNTFGFLMLLKFSLAEGIPIAHLMLFQDAQTVDSAPGAIVYPYLCKIVRKYFSKPNSPLFIQCPPDVIPEFNPTTANCTLIVPALTLSLTFLNDVVFPRFKESPFYASYDRFVQRSKAPVTINDFEKLRCVGSGGFGKVHAVTKRDTGQLYAMKSLSKAHVVKRRMTSFVLREQMMLAKLESSFIVNLLYSFQDETSLYMCMDMMIGGDLKYQLEILGRLPESTVRFYAVELAYGIQYMHDQGYIHRDIKPQNIMFDQDGHMRLTDMGLAIECKPGEVIHGRSGTVGYMSPEVVSMKQGSQPADWWALGVVLYEMAFGSHPFAASSKEESNAKVVSHEVVFPSRASDELKSLLRHLLTRDTSNRLGANGGIAQLKAHTFFEHIDWEAMYRRDIRPPFTPAERANVNGVYDFEEQLAGSDHHHTQNTHAIGNTEQQKFQSFDFVNPRALQEEFFRVARTYQADLFVA